ncbi:MAG: hypothetical protein AAB895_02925, partial [Patescibacteria group bacterium]
MVTEREASRQPQTPFVNGPEENTSDQVGMQLSATEMLPRVTISEGLEIDPERRSFWKDGTKLRLGLL